MKTPPPAWDGLALSCLTLLGHSNCTVPAQEALARVAFPKTETETQIKKLHFCSRDLRGGRVPFLASIWGVTQGETVELWGLWVQQRWELIPSTARGGPGCSWELPTCRQMCTGGQSIGRQRWSLHSKLSPYLLSDFGVNRS